MLLGNAAGYLVDDFLIIFVLLFAYRTFAVIFTGQFFYALEGFNGWMPTVAG